MRVLLIGQDGVIGSALADFLRARGDNIICTTQRPERVKPGVLLLNLTSQINRSQLPEADVAIFCAALTGYSRCRENPIIAEQVNSAAPHAIAQSLSAQNTRCIYLSTSAVFDGSKALVKETEPVSPITTYGATKADGEKGVLALDQRHAVARFTKVLSLEHSLVSSWIKQLKSNEPVSAFSDMTLSPILLENVVKMLVAIMDEGSRGIHHLSGSADVSYAELALYLARQLGVNQELVKVRSVAEAHIPRQEAPPYTSLGCGRMEKMAGFLPPHPYEIADRLLSVS